MLILIRRFLTLLLLFSGAGLALAAELPQAPPMLGDGLALVELRKRCDNCEPWRVLEFRSNTSPTPVWRDKVSVRAGVTAMYAYPGSDYFANVKLEQSMPGMFEKDKALVIQFIDHEFRRVKARVASYLEANPETRAKLEVRLAPGKDYMSFERGTGHGIDYVSYTDNVIGLTGGTISQIHFFVPGRETIVTAYLLNQKRTKFTNIEEFLRLRADFIRAWTEHLSRGLPVGAGAGDHAGDQQHQGGGLEAVRPAALPQEAV
jgi:hypothetical protein